MARLDISVDGISKLIEEAVAEAVVNGILRRREQLQKELVQIWNEEARKQGEKFLIPDNNQAVQLGIQDDPGSGKIDENKRSKAWQSLLTTHPESAITIIPARTSRRNERIFTFEISADPGKFYRASQSLVNVPATEKSEAFQMPWMRWFIEGKTIGGSQFVGIADITVERLRRVSRTGRGIMIKGGVWTFTGGFSAKGPGATNIFFDKVLGGAVANAYALRLESAFQRLRLF